MIKKALIFDMDGVVVNNDKYHFRAWQVFAEKHGTLVSDEQVRNWFGNTNPQILKNLLNSDLSMEKIRNYSEEKEFLYREIYAKDIKPLEGLKNFLEVVRQEGIRIGLATSAPPENVAFVLGNTGLHGFFDVITDDTQITHGKPHPEIFQKTAAKLNVLPVNTIVFEDSFHGIEASRKAGMKVIGVATTHPAEKLGHTDYVIHNFNEMNIQILSGIWKKCD